MESSITSAGCCISGFLTAGEGTISVEGGSQKRIVWNSAQSQKQDVNSLQLIGGLSVMQV